MKQTTGLLLLLPLLLLMESSCSGLPSKRQMHELTWKDGTTVQCLEPLPDVIAIGVKANSEVAAQKIGTLLKGTAGVGVDIERIRQELPSDVSAFELVEFKICMQYGNQVLSKEEYRAFTEQILPPIKKGTPAVSNEWPRLTDSDRTQLSLMLSNGNRYKIEIFRTPLPDCVRLANDFYDVFTKLQWTILHKPQPPGEFELEPGIRVTSIGDDIRLAPIKNMKERSGALLLVQALEKIRLPVMYEVRGGMIADLTIHLEIGMKPERN